MKRFTETLKWDDVWFRGLLPHHKLAFLYIIDRCDNAGFWEIDREAMAFHTKLSADEIEGALKGLERGLVGASEFVWVKNFLRHQKNDVLKAENPAHKQILNIISGQVERFRGCKEFFTLEGALKGLISPIGIGKGKGKGKEEGTGEKQTKAKGTEEEVCDFFISLGLPKSDATWFFHKCMANGWKNGANPILDWKATIRSWQAASYLPSQKGFKESKPLSTAPAPGDSQEVRFARLHAANKLRKPF